MNTPTTTAPTAPESAAHTITRVGLVGHCGFDSSSLTRLVRAVAPEAQVFQVGSPKALDELGPDTLLLVNRVLGGGFATDRGIDLIQQVAARQDGPRTLLISNLPDPQQAAEQAGAKPGFGKDDVGTPRGKQRLRQAMA